MNEHNEVCAIKYLWYADIIRELIRIFGITSTTHEEVCGEYWCKFINLVNNITCSQNEEIVKSAIKEISENYIVLFEAYHEGIYYSLRQRQHYLAIMCMLMDKKLRYYYIPNDQLFEAMNSTFGKGNYDYSNILQDCPGTYYSYMNTIYKDICEMIGKDEFQEKLGKALKISFGSDVSNFNTLESFGKKYMILDMGIGDKVESRGIDNKVLGYYDVKNRFPIVKDVKCNCLHGTGIKFMEV